MGSQVALLAMADAFPSHASVRRIELDRFRASVHEVSLLLVLSRICGHLSYHGLSTGGADWRIVGSTPEQ